MDLGSGDVRFGIVGSQQRTDREGVETHMAKLAPEPIVSTESNRGPDCWTKAAAQVSGLTVAVHQPDLQGGSSRWQVADRYHARNRGIIDDSDMIVAFVAPDLTGGTEDRIGCAIHAGEPVEVR